MLVFQDIGAGSASCGVGGIVDYFGVDGGGTVVSGGAVGSGGAIKQVQKKRQL
jgi:hypothetical protein